MSEEINEISNNPAMGTKRPSTTVGVMGSMVDKAAADWCNQTAIGLNMSKDINQKIRVLNYNARIENMATTIDESSSSVLKYQTPNFRY